jgi:16S rRNA C1402 N4-methylase RsmH
VRERSRLRLAVFGATMKIKELSKIAKELGEEKIIKMIEKETAKLRKRNDGMVKVADLADNLIAEMRSKDNG